MFQYAYYVIPLQAEHIKLLAEIARIGGTTINVALRKALTFAEFCATHEFSDRLVLRNELEQLERVVYIGRGIVFHNSERVKSSNKIHGGPVECRELHIEVKLQLKRLVSLEFGQSSRDAIIRAIWIAYDLSKIVNSTERKWKFGYLSDAGRFVQEQAFILQRIAKLNEKRLIDYQYEIFRKFTRKNSEPNIHDEDRLKCIFESNEMTTNDKIAWLNRISGEIDNNDFVKRMVFLLRVSACTTDDSKRIYVGGEPTMLYPSIGAEPR